MESYYKILGLSICVVILVLILVAVHYYRKRSPRDESNELGSSQHPEEELEMEELVSFPGGEDLTVLDILDAPGEVMGKSCYGTIYKASILRNNSLMLLRFLRPACTGSLKDILPAIQQLGLIRHPNLVPLQAFYSGPRGEKLLVHPFFTRGTLSQFLQSGNQETHNWIPLYRISIGIAKGLDYLHTGFQKPVIHGNLKSKNILLDRNYQPYLSDFGLHLLLNPTASQEMLEVSAAQGYKAPELIKMKDASKESDIYSMGVILLEILTGKEPFSGDSCNVENHLVTSLRNAILDQKLSECFNSHLINENDQNPVTEEDLLMLYQLALGCCSPSPSLRPDTKHIIRKLEEIGLRNHGSSKAAIK